MASTTPYTETAKKIVDDIVDDMNGRSGLGNELEQCDQEILQEIRDTWEALIVERLREAGSNR